MDSYKGSQRQVSVEADDEVMEGEVLEDGR